MTARSREAKRLSAAVALVAALGAAGGAAQSPPGTTQSGFELIDDYYLEVAGKPSADASLYASSQTRAILVVAGELPAPVLLWPRTRTVETLQMLKVARRPDGTAEVLANPVIATHPPFEVRAGTVSFLLDGVAALLKPKPPLVGLFGLGEMLASSKVYAQRAAAYEPSAELIEALRAQPRSVRVRVFFGTWCPACGQMVPRIMRVAEELGEDSRIAVEFYGLPRGFAGEPEATRLGIEAVPTGVVFVDGREVGRIAGNNWRRPERSLGSLLGIS